MEIRKASVQDLGQIMQVYDKARKFMREMAMQNSGVKITPQQN